MALTTLQQKRPTATPAGMTQPQPVQPSVYQGRTAATAAPTARPTAALTAAKAPTATVRPGGAAPAPTPTAAAVAPPRQQTGATATGQPIYAPAPPTGQTASPMDIRSQTAQAAPMQTLAGRGPGINPQTGQRYTEAELAALAPVPNTTGTDSRSYLINPQTGLPYTQQELAALPPGSPMNVTGTNGSQYVIDPQTGIAYTPEEYAMLHTANQGPVGSTGPGITGGVQQTQFTGLDLTDPGAAEQFFGENAWRFALPNALTEQGAWWQQNMGQVGQPGVAEDTFTATAPQLRNQGFGENYVQNLAGTYRPGSYPTGSNLSSDFAATFTPGGDTSNRADEFFQQFMGSIPEFNLDAGLNPYYDRAREKAANDINRQMAARGMWGSSAAGGLIGQAMTDLNAEQANREAQYYLDTLGEMRGWQGLGGDLASSSDTSSRGQAENERAWAGLGADVARSADDVTARLADQERGWATDMGQLGLSADSAQRARLQQLLSGSNDAQRAMLERLGFGADMTGNLDQAELQRLTAGMSAASQAQGAQRQRGQDYFTNTLGMGNAMEGVMSGQYNPMITEDKTLLDDILSMLVGSGAERLAGAQRETAGAQQTQNAQQQALFTALLMGLA